MAALLWYKTSTCSLLAIDKMVQSFLSKTTDETGASMYQCIECGKISKVCTNLKDHIEATHIQGLQLECHLCFKPFKSRGRLSFHIRTTHKQWNDSPQISCQTITQVSEQTSKLWFSRSWPKLLMWTTPRSGSVCNVERLLGFQPTLKIMLKHTTWKTFV